MSPTVSVITPADNAARFIRHAIESILRLRRRRMSGLMRRAFRLMAAAPIEGHLVEFGVYKGDGLSVLARLARGYLRDATGIVGFDSFEGMPASAVPLEGALAGDWAQGAFGDTSLDAVRRRLQSEDVRVDLVQGLFGHLAPLRDYGVTKVRFAHVDADIYEGYRDALRLLTPVVRVGTVMLFDEVMPPPDPRYQGIREHGRRALLEWEAEAGVNLHLIRFESTAALYVIVDEDYLRQYARVIVRLRRDTIADVMRSYAKVLLGRWT